MLLKAVLQSSRDDVIMAIFDLCHTVIGYTASQKVFQRLNLLYFMIYEVCSW